MTASRRSPGRLAVAVLATGGLLVAGAACAREARRPNLILIVADDLGYGDLGSYGNPDVRTPEIDRLASRGMRLTGFHAAAPVCSPTRASLLTGLYPQRLGIRDAIRDERLYLPAGVPTLASLLRDAGYATAHVGKWHLGGMEEGQPGARDRAPPGPLEHGFEHYLALLQRRPELQELARSRQLYRRSAASLLVRDDRPAGPSDLHLADVWVEESLALIERFQREGRPFFLNLWFILPHRPYEPSPREYLAGAARPGKLALYRGMLAHLDASVGRILARLEELGISEDTVVVFTSDNGPTGPGSAGPWRGRKHQLLEGGIRVPLIAVWPGQIPVGKTSDVLAHSNDLLPTFAEAAGLHLPAGLRLDGMSLLPHLRSGAPLERDTLFWQVDVEGHSQEAVRHGDWKLLASGGVPRALYDLADDPGERRDRLAGEPVVRDTLAQELRAWLQETAPLSPWRPRRLGRYSSESCCGWSRAASKLSPTKERMASATGRSTRSR